MRKTKDQGCLNPDCHKFDQDAVRRCRMCVAKREKALRKLAQEAQRLKMGY